MAPKADKKKDPGADAQAEAEAQRLKEAEAQKAREEEMKQKAEEEARRREEDEKRRQAEEQRRKDDDIRRAKEEEDRRIREKEREIQQIQLLEEKDKEINDLKEKIYALNRSYASIQNDYETEARRASQLTNELEVTQMKLIDVEGGQERKEKTWMSEQTRFREENHNLATSLAILQQNFDRLKDENDSLKHRALDETDALKSEMSQIRSDKDKDDTENTILMKLLHTELDKYKQQVAQLHGDLERKERDDVKNTIMLGLLNSQLDSGKEENRRLNDMLDDHRRKIDSLEKKLEEANARVGTKSTQYDELMKSATTQKDQLSREIEVHLAKINTLTETLSRTKEELENTTSHFLNFQGEAERKDKDSFEKNVILKADLEHTKRTLAQTQEQKKKDDDDHFSRNTLQSAEIDSLKLRIQKVQENLEKSEKNAFESSTLFKAEIETLKAKNAQLEESLRSAEKDAFEKITNLKGEVGVEKNALVQTKHLAERKEREYFEQLTRITSENETLHRQVLSLQTLNEKRDKEYIDNTVFLNAEKETLKNKVALLDEELKKQDASHQQYATRAQQQEQSLKGNYEEQLAALKASLSTESEKLLQQRQQLEGSQKRIQALETEGAKKDKDNWDKVNSLKAENQGLRKENDAQKETIEKLEGSIAENYNFKILAEQNELLKADLQSYKNQVANLNNTVATMKIESDILDNYKTKVLQEQNEQYLRRIQQLEKEQRMVSPLLNEMINTLQRHGLTTSLQADIDMYRQQVSRSSAASPNFGSEPNSTTKLSASAMGRKELSSLNTTH